MEDQRGVKLCIFSGVSFQLTAGLSLPLKTTAELELCGSWDVCVTLFPLSSRQLHYSMKCLLCFLQSKWGITNGTSDRSPDLSLTSTFLDLNHSNFQQEHSGIGGLLE